MVRKNNKNLLYGLGLSLGYSNLKKRNSNKSYKLNVGAFKDWILPEYFKSDTLNIKYYEHGGQMMRALDKGEIDIAYSVGALPIVNANREDLDIEVVDVALIYSMGTTTCFHSEDIECKTDLTAAIPLKTEAEYVFDKIVNNKKLQIKKKNNNDSNEAINKLINNKVDIACVNNVKGYDIGVKNNQILFKNLEELGIYCVNYIVASKSTDQKLIKEFVKGVQLSKKDVFSKEISDYEYHFPRDNKLLNDNNYLKNGGIGYDYLIEMNKIYSNLNPDLINSQFIK